MSSLKKAAEAFYDEYLAKMVSVGHGSIGAPTELTGGATGAFGLKPALKNEDLEPNQQHDVKRLSSINKLFGKESPREVAAIAVTDSDPDRILMGKRKDNGRWTTPGGHIENGENRRDGALRELREEAGIENQPITYMGSYPIPEKNLIVHAYKCHIFGGIHTDPHGDPDEEVDQWHWIDVENGLPKEILDNLHNKKDVVLNVMGLQSWDMKKAELEKGARGDWRKEGYTISHHTDRHGIHHTEAHDSKGNMVGSAQFWTDVKGHEGKLYVGQSDVDKEHRRKGLASAMYQHAENKTGMKVSPLVSQTSDSSKLWSQPNRPFGKTADEFIPNTGMKRDSSKPFVAGHVKEKIEKLKKGVMRRLAPYKPTTEHTKEKQSVDAWTQASTYTPEGPRENIPRMTGNARMRALHKLHATTKVRWNDKGEREFLLHRGSDPFEVESVTKEKAGKASYNRMSSWTPHENWAHSFAHGRPDETQDPARPGKVISAWIPESKIHSIPKQLGSVDPEFQAEGGVSEMERKEEHEVIVNPHDFDLHNVVDSSEQKTKGTF